MKTLKRLLTLVFIGLVHQLYSQTCTTTVLDEPFNTSTIVGANSAVIYGNGGSNHNASYALSGTYFGWFNIINGVGPCDVYDRQVTGLSIGCTLEATVWLRESYGGTNMDVSIIDDNNTVLATQNINLTGTYQLITLTTPVTTSGIRFVIHFNGVGGNGLDIAVEDLLITMTCPEASGTDTQTACGSFTWIDGNTYTSSNNTATHTITGGAANGCDSIVTLHLTINNDVNSTDVISSCTPIVWIDGNTYSTNNNSATHTYPGGAANGCDSIVTLDLTISSAVTSTDVQTACGSYTWIDGNTYTASNNTATFTYNGGAASGCDSIVSLDLTINNNVTSTDVQSACGSYTWIDGNTYTASNNTATHTITGGAANGCDSIITLDLTINNDVTSTDVQSACGTYTWIDGNTYTSSNNTATHTITGGAANGCDSIITLDLTINTNVNSTDVQSACGSFTWIDGNTYTTSNNTAAYTITGGASTGCDSIITLNLTINSSTTSTDIQSACGSYTWIDGITYTASNNTATHTITGGASNGCDSIITLDLTINSNANGTDIQTTCGSFTWIDGNTYTTSNNTATHTIIGGATNGCDSIVTLNLTITPPITIVVDTSVCAETDYTFADGTNHVNILQDQTHTSNLTTQAGCDSIVIENVTVTPIPTLDLGPDFQICEGESVTLNSSGTVIPVWNNGDSTNSISFSPINDTLVYATITDACGTASDTVNIVILPLPIVDAGADQTVPLGSTVNLSGSGANAYEWHPSSLVSCENCQNTTAFVTDTTVFLLYGIDENGCQNSDTLVVYVDGEIGVYIPNIFSPNNDGENDMFMVYGPSWKTYSLEIYNRWGSIIWSTNDPGTGWNGESKNGTECQQAVYVYKFRGISIIGLNYERSGNVMLTR